MQNEFPALSSLLTPNSSLLKGKREAKVKEIEEEIEEEAKEEEKRKEELG